MGGNDLDQASLLIAMLRHLGYPAEYVKGNILLTEEQALALTGADTFRHAADVLAAAGTPPYKGGRDCLYPHGACVGKGICAVYGLPWGRKCRRGIPLD